VVPPPASCDCHAHAIGPHDRYPLTGLRTGVTAPEASMHDYGRMLAVLGIQRCVLVQPGVYGTDNTRMLDAIAEAPERRRGVAVVEDSVTAAELDRLHRRGIRGIRFNTRGSTAHSAGRGRLATVETVRQAGAALARAGMHAQLLVVAADFPDIDRQLADLPVDVVIDHMGYPVPDLGTDAHAVPVAEDRALLGQAVRALSLHPPGPALSRAGATGADAGGNRPRPAGLGHRLAAFRSLSAR
jgi:predicted TIM-barrel fold metal-dependent hydrolase